MEETKILFVIAMQEEYENIKSKMQNEFNIENMKYDVLVTGIGKVNAASILTKKLNSNFKYSKVINLGTAGSQNLKIGDVVEVDELYYGDVDVSVFDYKIGQVPNMPEKYVTNQITNLQKVKCITTDSFISNFAKHTIIQSYNFQEFVVDMEATALAQVAYLENISFSCIKAISDNANEEADKSFKQNYELAAQNLAYFVDEIIKGIKK